MKQLALGHRAHKVSGNTNAGLTPKPFCKTPSHTAALCCLAELTSSLKDSLANGEAEAPREKDLPKAGSKGGAWVPGLLPLTTSCFPLGPLVYMENEASTRSPKRHPLVIPSPLELPHRSEVLAPRGREAWDGFKVIRFHVT